MSKRKILKKSDEETLKHYISYEGQPGESIPGTEDPGLPDPVKQPHLKKILKNALASKPAFIKAKVAVDHVMDKRKSAVIDPPSKSKGK